MVLVEPPSPVAAPDPVAARPVCPYLRLADGDDLLQPGAIADLEHRCLADGTPAPLSLRQQELVCLRAAHVDCPRFSLASRLAEPAAGGGRRRIALPVAAALLLLVLCAGVSAGFVLQRGGIALPTATATPSAEAVVSPSPTAPPPSAEPSPSTVPTSPPATPPPATSPPATPVPSPAATTAPSPSASIGTRVSLLTPCPGEPNCYIYKVRKNDILSGIAYYFGVPLATIYEMNPKYAHGTVLKTGDLLRLPPPTRL